MNETSSERPPLTDDRFKNAMYHLTGLLMKYEGHDRTTAREIAIKMSEQGSDYEPEVPLPASTAAEAAADAFMNIFGFRRVDEVLSIRKGKPS